MPKKKAILYRFMLVCVLVSFGWIFAPIECQAWWDPDYAYQRQLTIDAAVYGYSVKLVLTGAEAADIYNKSLSSGDDFRVTWYDSSVWTDLDRELESFTSSNITVWFRIQEPAGWAGGLSNYYLYYGNSTPAAVKADKSLIYDLWDDFDDWTNWTRFTEEGEYENNLYDWPDDMIKAAIAGGEPGSGTSVTTVNLPSTPGDGDLLLVVVATSPSNVDASINVGASTGTQSGWTPEVVKTQGSIRIEVFSGISDGTGGSVTADLSPSADHASIYLWRFKYVDTSDPIGDSNSDGGSSTVDVNYSIPLNIARYGDAAFGVAVALYTGSGKPGKMQHSQGGNFIGMGQIPTSGAENDFLFASEYRYEDWGPGNYPSTDVTGTLTPDASNGFDWAAVALDIKRTPNPPMQTPLPSLPAVTASGDLRIQNTTSTSPRRGIFHNSFTTSSAQDFAIRTKARKTSPGGGHPLDTYQGVAGWYHTGEQYSPPGGEAHLYRAETKGGSNLYTLSKGEQTGVTVVEETPSSDPVSGTWYVYETFVKANGTMKFTRDGVTHFPSDGDFTDTGDTNLTDGRICIANNDSDGYYDWILVRKFVDPEPTVTAGAESTACTFDYRRSITIDGDKVGGSSGYLENFPLLVKLSGDWLKNAPTGNIEDSDGYDIIFRGLDATTCDGPSTCGLSHEIEQYDEVNGELIAWVRVPKVYAGDGTPGSDTVIYMYYGNTCTTAADDPQDVAGVWSYTGSPYKGVWHLPDDPSAGTADSTSNNNNGTAQGDASSIASGQIDGAFHFDGDGDYIDAGTGASLNMGAGDLTLEAWFKVSVSFGDSAHLAGKGGAGAGGKRYVLTMKSGDCSSGKIKAEIDDDGGSKKYKCSSVQYNQDGGWHHAALVRDGTNLRLYMNGDEDLPATDITGYGNIDSIRPFLIGALIDEPGPLPTASFMNGDLDEVRISSVAHTANWIKTGYNNQNDPGDVGSPGFYAMGAEEGPGVPTAISLLSFTAIGAGNAVQVDWQTAREFDNVGFHLYRATAPGGPYTRLTDKLISARPRQGQGGGYSYVDADVTVGRLYYYKLEDIDIYGTHTLHGPISVDWDGDGLPDDWEITRGLNPWVNDADLDSDGDGLTNLEEYERDLDPFNPDTDDDGILDGAEDGRLEAEVDSGSRELTRGVEVLSEDDDGVTLELITTGFEAKVVQVGAGEFEQLHIADYVHGYTDELGAPQLPLKGILIDIPAGKVAELSVLKTELEPYYGYRIYPVPEDVIDKQGTTAGVGQAFVHDESAYTVDEFYPQTVAQLGQSYVFRDQIKQQVIFYPLDFNAVSGQLNLYERIRVRIDYVDNTLAKAIPARAGPWQPPLLASASDGLSTEQVSALTLLMPPMVVNPLAPMLSSMGAAIAALWSPPEGSGSAVYKISTSAAGIYRMDRDFLLAQGLDVAEIDAIDLDQIRLFNLGQEVVIDIYDQGVAGELNAGDYIEFYAVAVDDAYAKYSAQNIYWLTLTGGAGVPKRMASDDGAPAGGVLADDFVDTARHEQDLMYWLKAPGTDGIERWFFNIFVQGTEHPGGGQPKAFTISVPEPLSTGTLTILMAGQTDTDHEVRVAINGSEQSFMWPGISYYEATVNDVNLFAGDNTVTLQCLSADGNDSIAVDWFEVAYRRDYVAGADNTLKFAPDNGSRYVIDGFSSDTLRAYDISDTADVMRLTDYTVSGPDGDGNFSIEFEPASPGDTYLVAASDAIDAPGSLVADSASSLFDTENSADYILITHRDIGWDQNGDAYGWLEDLATLRQAQGLRVEVVDIEDIYDEFSFGIKSPQALKDFLSYAYSNWEPPAARYVLLVGDSTYDPKDHWNMADATAYLPTYLIYTDYKGETVTDEWFVTISGEDAIADMHIGRLPAADATQAALMVAKILTYETTPNTKFVDPDAWEKNILLVADDQRPGAQYLYEADFATMNDAAASLLPAPMEPYAGYLGIHYSSAAYLTDFITTTLNTDGALMVNYSGHGGTQVWADQPSIFDTVDIAGLTNTAELPFFVSMSCETGFFAYPENWFVPSMGEALLRSDTGAVAALMPTGMTTTPGQRILNSALFEHIFSEDIRTLGPAIATAKQTLLANGDAYFEQISQTFLLFGDPATVLKVPLPRRPAGLRSTRPRLPEPNLPTPPEAGRASKPPLLRALPVIMWSPRLTVAAPKVCRAWRLNPPQWSQRAAQAAASCRGVLLQRCKIQCRRRQGGLLSY
jgi:hypothetical protein